MSFTNSRVESKVEVKSHETYHPLYVIYSRWSFDDIYGFLGRYTNDPKSDIGSLRVDYDLSGRDTHRTFVLLSNSVANALRKEHLDQPNHSGFSFSRYRVKDFVPNGDSKPTRSLCVPLPNNLGMKGSEISALIKSKLSEAIEFGIINSNDVTVTVPLGSREADV